MPSDLLITSFSTRDVRFPTSLDKTGSDAMNEAGDYSAAYCILHTSRNEYSGHGMSAYLPLEATRTRHRRADELSVQPSQ